MQAPNYGVTAPCSAKGEDGTPATTVDNPSITIRVLNGTSFSGFAQAVAKGLENRGFTVQGYDTLRDNNNAGEGFVTTVERTTIYFGRNAINQAYTLNDNFTDAIMVMDDREDALIGRGAGRHVQESEGHRRGAGAGLADRGHRRLPAGGSDDRPAGPLLAH